MKPNAQRVLGVLAGGDVSPTWLANWSNSADLVVAADGGADLLVTAGVPAEIAIGDLDSIQSQSYLRECIHNADQDTSDCDKLLSWLHTQGVNKVTLAGVEGDRLDHVLGTLASAARSPLEVRLAMRRGLGWIVKDSLEVAVLPGELVSLMPLTLCQGVRLSGVQWPLEGVDLDVLGTVSLSNRAMSPLVNVSLETGVAVLFVLGERLETPLWE